MTINLRAVAIDCGMPWTANRVLNYLSKENLKLEHIFLTHSHFDHVMGMNRLRKRVETKVVASTRSKRDDVKVADGDLINAIDNQLNFLVLYTGVHKTDHVWYYETINQILFVGDCLPTLTELKTLKKRHAAEPKIILPGHGELTFLPNGSI